MDKNKDMPWHQGARQISLPTREGCCCASQPDARLVLFGTYRMAEADGENEEVASSNKATGSSSTEKMNCLPVAAIHRVYDCRENGVVFDTGDRGRVLITGGRTSSASDAEQPHQVEAGGGSASVKTSLPISSATSKLPIDATRNGEIYVCKLRGQDPGAELDLLATVVLPGGCYDLTYDGDLDCFLALCTNGGMFAVDPTNLLHHKSRELEIFFGDVVSGSTSSTSSSSTLPPPLLTHVSTSKNFVGITDQAGALHVIAKAALLDVTSPSWICSSYRSVSLSRLAAVEVETSSDIAGGGGDAGFSSTDPQCISRWWRWHSSEVGEAGETERQLLMNGPGQARDEVEVPAWTCAFSDGGACAFSDQLVSGSLREHAQTAATFVAYGRDGGTLTVRRLRQPGEEEGFGFADSSCVVDRRSHSAGITSVVFGTRRTKWAEETAPWAAETAAAAAEEDQEATSESEAGRTIAFRQYYAGRLSELVTRREGPVGVDREGAPMQESEGRVRPRMRESERVRLVTGSYDEKIRVFEYVYDYATEEASLKLLFESKRFGDGIYRLKRLPGTDHLVAAGMRAGYFFFRDAFRHLEEDRAEAVANDHGDVCSASAFQDVFSVENAEPCRPWLSGTVGEGQRSEDAGEEDPDDAPLAYGMAFVGKICFMTSFRQAAHRVEMLSNVLPDE